MRTNTLRKRLTTGLGFTLMMTLSACSEPSDTEELSLTGPYGALQSALRAKETVSVTALGEEDLSDVDVEVEEDVDHPGNGQDKGKTEKDKDKIKYTAPESIGKYGVMHVHVKRGKRKGQYKVHLIPDGDIGISDNGVVAGLVGKVYSLPVNTSSLPDFSTLEPMDTIVAPNIDNPNRPFEQGFPGVRSLFEWFAIQFRGVLILANAGNYTFRLTADDGAKLYIDDHLVIANDGIHPVTSRDGTVTLLSGMHRVRVDYFQGPRYYIALQLLWKTPGSSQFEIVPSANFNRPR